MNLQIKAIIAQKVLLEIIYVFTGAFFIAHLFEAAKSDIAPIAIFNIVYISSLIPAFFIFSGMLARGRLLLLHRIGIIGMVAFLGALMLLKENVMEHIVVMGILFGFASEAWWLPFHVWVIKKVAKQNQPKFNGYLHSISGVAAIIAPVALGAIIGVGSFERAALVMLIVAAAMFIVSFIIGGNGAIKKPRPLRFIGFFKDSIRERLFIDIYITEFLRGICFGGALGIIPIIYATYLFGGGLNLGIFLSAFAVAGIAIHAAFGRFITYRHFPALLYTVVASACGVAFAFTLTPSIPTFLLFQFCFVALMPLINSIGNINFYNASKKRGVKEQMTEFFGARELFLNLGRIASLAVMLFAAGGGEFGDMKYLLFIFTILTAGAGVFALLVSKRQER